MFALSSTPSGHTALVLGSAEAWPAAVPRSIPSSCYGWIRYHIRVHLYIHTDLLPPHLRGPAQPSPPQSCTPLTVNSACKPHKCPVGLSKCESWCESWRPRSHRRSCAPVSHQIRASAQRCQPQHCFTAVRLSFSSINGLAKQPPGCQQSNKSLTCVKTSRSAFSASPASQPGGGCAASSLARL